MVEPLRVGVAGLGTVGASVIRLLDRQRQALAHRTGRSIIVTGVSARDVSRDRGVDIASARWFEDPVDLARSSDIDLFVELIGGDEGPARIAVETALKSRKSVVTANKALLAKHGMELAKLAEEARVALAFEASVAGGIPIVKTLREGLAGNQIVRVYGILNGTCNYILSRMEREEMSFEDCLTEAQRLGYAESDPTFDIGGFDTAHKLSILSSLAFGTAIDAGAVHIEGIQTISLADLKAAEELGYRIKLLGVAQRTEKGIEQRVHPTMVPRSPRASAQRLLACPSRRWILRRASPYSATRAATTSACRSSIGPAPSRPSPAAWRSGRFRSRASCSAAVSARAPPPNRGSLCRWSSSPTPRPKR